MKKPVKKNKTKKKPVIANKKKRVIARAKKQRHCTPPTPSLRAPTRNPIKQGQQPTATSHDEHIWEDTIPKEEQPYDIPQGWVWVRLGEVCKYIRAGGDKPKNFSKTKTDIYKVPVIANGETNEGIIGYTDIENEKKNTVTVAGRGTIGFSLIRDYTYYPIVRLIVLAPSKIILPFFLKSIFDYFHEKGTGSAIPQLTVPMIKNKAIPLPPLSEQTLIVERIESLFNKLNRVKEIIENVQNKFPLRKAAILGRAFRGELTAQWREENKPLPLDNITTHNIPKEEQPYDIPEGWVWVRGVSCLLPMTTKEPTGKFFRYIDIDAINNKLQKVSEPKELLVSKAPSRASREVCQGDTLFSMVRPYLKNIAYINSDLANCIASTGFFVCRPNKTLNSHYLYYLMISNYMVDGLNFYMRGDNSPSIRPKNIYSFPFPLPPLSEQEEIVRRLESIFEKEEKAKELCNMLEKIELMKKAILARAFRGELTVQ